MNLLNKDFDLSKGYYGAGLQKILDAVNVPKSSFYNYFCNKKDFGAEVIQHYTNSFVTQPTSCLDNADGDASGSNQTIFGIHYGS